MMLQQQLQQQSAKEISGFLKQSRGKLDPVQYFNLQKTTK
jgi:hypothetical protein